VVVAADIAVGARLVREDDTPYPGVGVGAVVVAAVALCNQPPTQKERLHDEE